MDKKELTDLVKKGTHSQEKLLGWISALPTGTNTKPSYNKIGDVYMSPVFMHPYILLQRKGDSWLAGLLTSSGDCPEVLESCQSRFFENSFITKALFTVSEPQGSFKGTYDNTKHLREVLIKLKIIFK